MKALQHLNKYFIKYRWRLLIGIIMCILVKLLTLKIPIIIKNSLNVVEDYLNNKHTNLEIVKTELLWNIITIICLTLLAALLTFFMRQTLIVMSRFIEFDLKNEIYRQYQLLSVNFYKKNRTGDLMTRISEDVSKVRMYVGPSIMYSLNMIISFIICFYHMINISPELTLYTLIPLPILSVSIYLLSSQINKKSTEAQEFLARLNVFTQEFFTGITIVKSYVIEDRITKNFNSLANESKKKNLELSKVQAAFFPLMILLIGFSNIIVIYIGGQQVIKGEIQIGVIGAFIMYVNVLTWPVATLGWVASMVQQAAASQQRINQFLKLKPEIKNNCSKNTTIKGKIVFDNVSLVYDDTNITALKNISFTAEKGDTIGIIGKTGSGKSSIINLISRLYDCSSGTIYIDDQPIQGINLYDLRKSIAPVPQNPFLFSDTIANNIRFGKEDATITEIEKASKLAEIHKNIINFKNKYDTIIGERGVTLSGGQKQRTAIARALIKTPEIIILDDCLSAVDTETEEQILKNLEAVCKDKTTFIVTHRLSSIKKASKILVLEKGQIIAQGSHKYLIETNDYYKELYLEQIAKDS